MRLIGWYLPSMHMPTRRVEVAVLGIAITVFVGAAAIALGVAAWDMMLGPCACTILSP